MNQRNKEILHLLAEKNNLHLQDLSVLHDVSERTIRNDIAQLNDYLKNSSLGMISIKNKIVQMNLEVETKEFLAGINQFDAYEYKFTSDERSLVCLLMLLNSHTYVTIQQLSEKLLMSRSTIVNDIKNMRKLAAEHSIDIVSRSNKGYRIAAKEEDVRQFMYEVIQLQPLHLLETIVFEKSYQDMIDLKILESCLEELKKRLAFSEKDLSKLSHYLTISAYRNKIGFPLEQKRYLKRDSIYAELINCLSLKNYHYLTETDFVFIEEIFEKTPKTDRMSPTLSREFIRIQVIVMKFIEKISQDLNIDFKNDYIFYENFSSHIMRMLRRETEWDKKTFFVDDVIKSNRKIQQVILENLSIIEENIDRRATDVEIDYILIHVYAAMERKKRKGSSLKVALITEEKVAEIFLIESKLLKHFSFQLDVYSVDERISNEYDLILTTAVLANRSYLQISPFVSDEDYILIANRIDYVMQKKEPPDFALDKKVALHIYEMLQKEIDKNHDSKEELQAGVRKIIFHHIRPEEEKRSAKQLFEFLTPDRIELDVDANTWQEAVYQAGQKLIDAGAIKTEYLDVIIDNINNNGPYIVISKGFAFPHAEIGDYNKATAMNLIRLARPVYFEDEARDVAGDITTMKVKYVCILSAVDKEEHLRAFFNLSNLLKDSQFKLELDSCTTPLEMHRIIEKYEYLFELRR